MKQWLSEHILSTDDVMIEEFMPISNAEFVISISMVVVGLAVFVIVIHLFGA